MTTPMLRFLSDENGAVTVDWVVLTAGIVGLGLATYGVVSGGVADASSDVSTQLTNQQIVVAFEVEAAGGFDIASSQLVGPDHSEAWRTDMLTRFYPEMTEGQLNSYYAERVAEYEAGVGNYGNAIDHIGIGQAEFARRGLDVPEGSPDYEAIRDAYVAQNG